VSSAEMGRCSVPRVVVRRSTLARMAPQRLLLVLILIASPACDSAVTALSAATAAPLSAATATPHLSGATSKDCGSFVPRVGQVAYDAAGLECFWAAYTAGTSAHWAFRQVTMEGDPIPSTITFDPQQGIVVTHDSSADNYGGPDRRLMTWRCGILAKKAWPNDSTHLYLEASGCSGDGKTTSFP
jgi:hypothetical protein